MTEHHNIRRFAAKLADRNSSADKLVAGFINRYIETLGENASVDGVQHNLIELIKTAHAVAIKLESCRESVPKNSK